MREDAPREQGGGATVFSGGRSSEVLSRPALEAVVRAMGEPALAFDADAKLVAASPAAVQRFGLASAEDAARRQAELADLAGVRGPAPAAGFARGEERLVALPTALRRGDAHERALVRALSLPGSAEAPAFWLVFFREPPSSFAQGLEGERAAHVEAAGAAAWSVLPSSGTVTWSERGRALFNLPGAVVTLGAFLEALHPEDRPRIERAVAQSLREVGAYDEEMRVRAGDGSERWVECLGRALADESGNAREMAGIALEITGRKRAEMALRASDEKLRLALDAAQMGTWELDVARSQVALSDRTRTLLGFSPGSAPESLESLFFAVHPEDRERIRSALRAALEQRALFDEELRPALAGSARSISCTGRAYPDDSGRPARVAGTARDITARRRAEEALREADERKSEFLAVLSHELRNPLAPIKNSLALLSRLPAGASAAERALEVVGRQVEHLSRLVDDLLDLTRISRNRIELKPERLDLGEAVRTTLEDHRSLFEAKRIRLEMAPPEHRVFVRADPTRVAQIVGNLLQNSAKFTPAEGEVRVTVAEEGGQAVLRVADSGIGMPAPVLARLFQPFAQPNMSLDRAKGGLGLGLALVKGLAELQGGDVSAFSEGLGKGSELVVRLPLDAPEPLSEPPEPPAEHGRRRVLLIEDNVDAADSLRDLLAMEGHEVEVAYDGPSGIARARALKPQIVFCDIGLPGMDGYEVAHVLRADQGLKGSYLVALSGYALPEDVESAKSAGFDQHMAKPPRLEQIEALLGPEAP